MSAILVAAVIGAFIALLVQNIAWPILLRRLSELIQRRRTRLINRAWASLRQVAPNLELLQAGWLADGTFGKEHIRLTLGDPYHMPPDLLEIRRRHEAKWMGQGYTDGEQVGISSFQIRRISDEPGLERAGRSHVIDIRTHTYHYFDFLATHRLLISGAADERATLRGYARTPNAEEAIQGFPNALSVGLSLFCHNGDLLVLVVRTKTTASGGQWQGGQCFNAVGENATPGDFSATLETSALAVARRGLFEEMGLSYDEISECHIAIHSLAWARDILDHKFFGYCVTELPLEEVRRRWEAARDRSENREVRFVSTSTHWASVQLWREMSRQAAESWSPEAFFCTTRSLLLLGKLKAGDLVQ